MSGFILRLILVCVVWSSSVSQPQEHQGCTRIDPSVERFCPIAYDIEAVAQEASWLALADSTALNEFNERIASVVAASGAGSAGRQDRQRVGLCTRLLHDVLCGLSFRGKCEGGEERGEGLLKALYGKSKVLRPCYTMEVALQVLCNASIGTEDINFGHRQECFFPLFLPPSPPSSDSLALSPSDYAVLGDLMREASHPDHALSLLLESVRRNGSAPAAAASLYSLAHAAVQAAAYEHSLHVILRDQLEALQAHTGGCQCKPPPPSLPPSAFRPPSAKEKAAIIGDVAARHRLPHFVETGTFTGVTLLGVHSLFASMTSFEISRTLHNQALANLRARRVLNARLVHGDSRHALPAFLRQQVEQKEEGPYLFWLDAHFSGSDWFTAIGDLDYPLLQELVAIMTLPRVWCYEGEGHVILIDDASSLVGAADSLAGKLKDMPSPSILDICDVVCAHRPSWVMSVEGNILRIHAPHAP